MTDLETMRDMLKRARIAFEETVTAGQIDLVTCGGDGILPPGCIELTIARGYPFFVSVLTFEPDGSLANIAAWE